MVSQFGKFLTRVNIDADKLHIDVKIEDNRFMIYSCKHSQKKDEGIIYPFTLDKISHIDIESVPGGKVLISLDVYE